MKVLTKEIGITLIALVVTVIILLIIAGVAVSMITGNDGLFSKANEAGIRYNEAAILEKEELDSLQYMLDKFNKDLPDNTPNTAAGTSVKMPKEWFNANPTLVAAESGEILKLASLSGQNVLAISDGIGNVIPVPKDFYYVGGDLESGIVISDNIKDKNKAVGISDVTAGVSYNSDGTVKTYTNNEYENLSDDEKKDIILGNQFVWIPVSKSEYVKTNWGISSANWETQTNITELAQIKKYGGFYVGRYEAGTSNITLSTNIDFASKNTATNWINDNFSIRDGVNHSVTGKITQKAGEIPYYHADYFTALKLCNDMYSTDYVQSGMITGTMWDIMIKFITDNDNSVITETSWGNYVDTPNTAVTYNAGKGRYATVNSTSGAMTSAFTVADGAYHSGINTTAISEDVKRKNVYDVAGNLWEWSQEAAFTDKNNEAYILRGGSFQYSYKGTTACFRGFRAAADSHTAIGFRPVLYIK